MIRFSLRREQQESLVASFSSPYADRTIAESPSVEPAPPAAEARVENAPEPAPAAQHPEAAKDDDAPADATDGPDAASTALSTDAEATATPLFETTDAPATQRDDTQASPSGDDADLGISDAEWSALEAASAFDLTPADLAACNFIAWDPPRAAGRTFYVDADAGSDSNSGLADDAPFRTLAKVQSLLADGDMIQLRSGSVWHEQLRFSADDVTVRSYGSGDNPLIVGDGVRHGIVIKGENGRVENIDVTGATNGVYVAGADASVTIIGGTYTANGTGIVAGDGGRLILVDGAHCTGSRVALGAGDGIQINVDASAGLHTIRNVVCEGNDIAGINAKVGTVTVTDSVLSFNREPGWIAQNSIDVFNIMRCRIEGNNQSDNGTGQASIEDAAIVYSTDNLYIDPHNGTLATVQINILPSNGWTPPEPRDRPTALYSTGDSFINASGQTNTIGSIRVHTDDMPTIVSIADALFQHAAGSGVAVNAYGATALTLTIASTRFEMANTAAVRIEESAILGPGLETNSFLRADGGYVFRIGDSLYETGDLSALFAQYAGPDLAPESAPMLAFEPAEHPPETGLHTVETPPSGDYLFI